MLTTLLPEALAPCRVIWDFDRMERELHGLDVDAFMAHAATCKDLHAVVKDCPKPEWIAGLAVAMVCRGDFSYTPLIDYACASVRAVMELVTPGNDLPARILEAVKTPTDLAQRALSDEVWGRVRAARETTGDFDMSVPLAAADVQAELGALKALELALAARVTQGRGARPSDGHMLLLRAMHEVFNAGWGARLWASELFLDAKRRWYAEGHGPFRPGPGQVQVLLVNYAERDPGYKAVRQRAYEAQRACVLSAFTPCLAEALGRVQWVPEYDLHAESTARRERRAGEVARSTRSQTAPALDGADDRPPQPEDTQQYGGRDGVRENLLG